MPVGRASNPSRRSAMNRERHLRALFTAICSFAAIAVFPGHPPAALRSPPHTPPAAAPPGGLQLLSPEQPPQSPQEWERWWLHVTRKAIVADYLRHTGDPAHRTVNTPASYTPPANASTSPADAGDSAALLSRPRGLLELLAVKAARAVLRGIGGATRRSYPTLRRGRPPSGTRSSPCLISCR